MIVRGLGGLYAVRTEEYGGEELLCRARGIFRREELTPTVGDDVVIMYSSDSVSDADAADTQIGDAEKKRTHSHDTHDKGAQVDYVIDEILPRRSLMIRPALANLDYLFMLIPAASPEPDLLTADKLTAIAENYSIEVVAVVNKADLAPERAREIAGIYSLAGYSTFCLSAGSGDGVDELRRFISDASAKARDGAHVSGAFAGVSGAGKSTLMTALFPNLGLKTGDVSRKTRRGRHTTRHVELYPVDFGASRFWLADTPGFSMLDFTLFDFFPYDELAGSFREFGDCLGNCRYTKCTHLREEGCAVIEKMKNGGIAKSRHESYVKIFEEQRSVPEWKRRQEK